MKETTVSALSPGDVLRVDFLYGRYQDYRLIYVNQCRAYVEPLRRQKTDVLDDDEKKYGRTNIAPGTVCTLLSVKRDMLDDDDDTATPATPDLLDLDVDTTNKETTMRDLLDDDVDMLDMETPAAPAKPKTPRAPRTRSTDGRRTKEPGIQTREIKEGTIRHKLFLAMKNCRSLETLAKKMDMKKALLISHINEFNRAHGFGYSIDGDKVALIPPKKVAIKK